VEWFDCVTARAKLLSGQVEFLDRLLAAIKTEIPGTQEI
jgi:predicted NUDIX family NTP pyrophosphohydrolase